MKNNKTTFIILLFIFVLISNIQAQNNINLVRYNDDFSSLKNDTLKKGFDKLKYIKLADNKYISLGGEIREQYQIYNNINFGDVPPTYTSANAGQLWHRVILHADIELGNHFRIFMQLNNTNRFFNNNPLVPELDENQLSLHQAFGELNLSNWKFRLGQQELFYGNHRLITFREGPNTRLAFDGLSIKHKFNKGSIDFFAVSKVISKQYVFDDDSMHDGLLGIFGTQNFNEGKLGLDYFLVNFQSKDRKYNYVPGFENRQTCGIRLFSKQKTVNFEFEGAYQTGKFKNLTINAFGILADANVLLVSSKKGLLGFAANLTSGDKNSSDNKLNTYNSLYAKPAYGLAAPIGAANMISFNPYIKINPIKKLNVLSQVFFLSRNSSQDGTYSPGMIQVRPNPTAVLSSTKKSLGQLYILETNYQQSKHLSFSFDTSFFKAGRYPKETGAGKDILYLSLKSTFRF